MLYVRATDAIYGRELWKTNGTVAGTALVKDINPTGDSEPGVFFCGHGTLVFVADDGTHGFELWESNGTASGTVLVADINPGTPDSACCVGCGSSPQRQRLLPG